MNVYIAILKCINLKGIFNTVLLTLRCYFMVKTVPSSTAAVQALLALNTQTLSQSKKVWP